MREACAISLWLVLVGHAASRVHGQVHVRRVSILLSLLRKGLETLRYDEAVKVLVL